MSRPKYLNCVMTPEIIRSIREEQEHYDRNPEQAEMEQRFAEEERREMMRREREEIEEERIEEERIEWERKKEVDNA